MTYVMCHKSGTYLSIYFGGKGCLITDKAFLIGGIMKLLYGVGTGPGAKEYLTLKAVEVLEKADFIFAPNNNGKNMALDTVEEFIEGKEIVMIDFPMGRVTRDDYKKAAKTIDEKVENGQTGVFITIGDPMVYSTFIYIVEELEEYNDINVEIVSGIPSFIAAAGRSKMPITVKDDNFMLIDNLTKDDLSDIDLSDVNSVAVLKTFKDKSRLLDKLEENSFKYKYLRRVSLEDEEILENREEILDNKDYISLIIGRKK